MEDSGGLGVRTWGLPNQSLKENRVLQFISAVAEREKALMPPDRESVAAAAAAAAAAAHHGNARFMDRNGSISAYSVAHTAPIEFSREAWLHHRDLQCVTATNAKLFHPMPANSNYGGKDFGGVLHEPSATQMLQIGPSGAVKQEILQEGAVGMADGVVRTDNPAKKQPKKAKKARTKVSVVKDEANGSGPAQKAVKKNVGVVVNGLTLDLSCIPVPVCSCTGVPQQCYKWGSGGWQSACCTTSLSMYPLPMSQKRRGARIAGRKMSRGAFKKVLEKLLSEGHSLSSPVDLRPYWAKHGTNKFVTIR
ncbi:Barley B recombinant-like protein B [Nymphaea thermarum]|nr:Barley B recombinant-like protein B [Nymphaea thermarum]